MVGPITQSVTDAARILDVIAGYDPAGPSTAQGVEHIPESYTDYLNPDSLRDARIGILRSVFSSGPESEPVVEVATEAVTDLDALGGRSRSMRLSMSMN